MSKHSSSGRVSIAGGEHTPLLGARQINAEENSEIMEVTLVLRRRQALPDPHDTFGDSLPHRRRHLDHAEFTRQYGANRQDIPLVRRFAEDYGLKIATESVARRTVVVKGTRAQIADAFGVEFVHFEHERGNYHATTKSPSLPKDLAAVVEAVFGLQTRPAARRHGAASEREKERQRSILEISHAYEFPEATDGRGECIGLIELGGGFHESDIKEYCSSLGLKPPQLSCISVHGGKNDPAPAKAMREFIEVAEGKRRLPSSNQSQLAKDLEMAQCTVEVTMDVEIVAALAPAARVVVYFATMDEQGIYNALTSAIHDVVHRPSVLSLSWGEPEIGVSDAYVRLVDEAIQAAAHLGITVCASSGDAGALNHSPDHLPTVNFPASSPHCLGCGGTTTKFADSTIAEEAAWNSSHYGIKGATGGGISRKFGTPVWQHHADVPRGPTGQAGRGVPDVAGPADPRCCCEVLVAGESCVSAGTSAVAPLWAALIARCNQALGARCGYINPLLYKIAKHTDAPQAITPVKRGNNGLYEARNGWSACTGLGTPRGRHLLNALKNGLD